MINDDERDYAEERANLADMRREHEQEAAHEALVGRVTSALRDLSRDAYRDALVSVERLADEVGLRQAPNVHRYELLARQQHTALLAAQTAAAIEDGAGYDLTAATRDTISGYRATHMTLDGSDLPDRALGDAGARVFAAVRAVLDADADEQVNAREQADLDETEAHLRRVTR